MIISMKENSKDAEKIRGLSEEEIENIRWFMTLPLRQKLRKQQEMKKWVMKYRGLALRCLKRPQ